jgi:asparagine synthetase B (glutamine-hydrolysing)
MCSIGGFISNEPLEPWKARRLSSALLHFGLPRGDQSSGIYYNHSLVKRAVSATDMIQSSDFLNLFNGPNHSTVCLTHTRFPTSGEKGDDQAHPFWVGTTVSVHNGSIYNCKHVRDKWQLDKTSGVDSELFTQAIDKYGIAKLPEIVYDFSASASIATYHNDTLYLARDGNPLEYLTIIDGDNHITIFGSTQSQVLGAINHLWLIAKLGSTTTLPSNKLFAINAAGELDEIGSFNTMPAITHTTTSTSLSRAKRFWDDWDSAGTDICYSWRAITPRSSSTKNGGGSKAKKDRNRNGTAEHHKKSR